jgi:hypothetical protein
MNTVKTLESAPTARGQRIIRLRGILVRRWPAFLTAGLLTVVVPVSVAFASVKFEEFGASRFTNPGNCDVPYSGYPCAAVVGISTPNFQQNPGISGKGFVGVEGNGTYGVNGDGDLVGVDGFSSAGTGVKARGGAVGVLATGSGTSGVGVEAHGTALGVTALSDNTALGATGGKIGLFGSSYNGTAVQAESTNGTAIKATDTNGTVVDATSNKTAVRAVSYDGVAVNASGGVTAVMAYADKPGSDGVDAFGAERGVCAEGRTGVVGRGSTGVGGEFSGAAAPIRLVPGTTAGAPSGGTHQQGELYIDSNGVLYVCKTDGPSAVWVKVGSQ